MSNIRVINFYEIHLLLIKEENFAKKDIFISFFKNFETELLLTVFVSW